MIRLPDKNQSSDLEHCREMQEFAKRVIKEFPENKQTVLCLDDWFMEEMLLERETTKCQTSIRYK
jgi:hypothetical protein